MDESEVNANHSVKVVDDENSRHIAMLFKKAKQLQKAIVGDLATDGLYIWTNLETSPVMLSPSNTVYHATIDYIKGVPLFTRELTDSEGMVLQSPVLGLVAIIKIGDGGELLKSMQLPCLPVE